MISFYQQINENPLDFHVGFCRTIFLEGGMTLSGYKVEDKFEAQERYVADYRINLFEIAYLADEEVRRFKSDFRYVAEYFVANRKRKEGLTPEWNISLEHLKHVEEFIELMNAVTNSERFSELPKVLKERGGDSMFTILFDEAEARGEARGEARRNAEMVSKKILKGKTLEKTADEMETTPDKIRKYYDAACKYIPSFTGEELINKILSEVIDKENC